MTISNDMQLLKDYAGGKSEDAFAALVSRHINLVYSTALRRTSNPHHAEEITQSVFLTLARKAKELTPATILSGWLYQTARLTASNFLRTEIRRQHREQEAYMESVTNEPEPDLWRQVGPVLDEAMAELSEADRNAVVLRFFENKPMKDVGAALGASDDAAKMRVNRAVDKLRGFFEKRGIPISAAGLATVIAENSVQAAPAGLAAAVVQGVGHSLATGAVAMAATKGAASFMTWTKIGFAVGAAAVAVVTVEVAQVKPANEKIAQLQEQLQKQAQLSQNQATQIETLDRQNLALHKQMESNARETAQARNRVSMANAAAAAAKASARNGNNFAAMFKDPAMLDMMRGTMEKTVRKQYGPLIKQLNLTSDQGDKLIQLLVDHQMDAISRNPDLLGQGDLSGIAKAASESQQQLNAAVKDMLGDGGFAQFQEYQSGMPDRMALEQMKEDFASDPLTAEQQQQLLQLMQESRKAVTANAPTSAPGSQTGFSTASSPEAMNQALQQQETINQQVLQQAGSFLSPAQVQTLATSQSNFVNMEKAGFAMAQKMFNLQSNNSK
jgi:RNA polymerase sigma factor (sigma-70 family)